jgi:uncharacterized repeat protein (TIGR01451 family)
MTRSAVAFLATFLTLLVGCSTTEGESKHGISETRRGEYPDAPIREEHVQAAPVREEPAEETLPVVKRPSDGLYWTERAYPTGEKSTSMLLLESGTPTKVNAGTRYEYILRVTNLSQMNLDNVVVTDKPEGNFQLVGSNPKAEAGKDLRWNLGSLRPDQSKEIRISGTAIDQGHVTHCAEVDWRSLFCSTTQVVKSGLTISKTATAETLVCDPITYSVTVSNGGSGTTRNVVIEDRLPDGIETLEGKNIVQYTLPAIEPGESKTFTWKAKAMRTGKFTNMASAKADGNLVAKSGEIWTTVTKPVLTFDKKGTKQAYLGRTIAYEMTLRNLGDGEARDVVVTNPLPAGTKFVAATEGGTQDGEVVRWKLGNLAPGATRTFTLKVSAPNEGKVRSTATASAYCADAVTVMAETAVKGISAILLEVVDLNDPVEVGGATTYVITATNQGSGADTNIRIAVELEDTMGYVSASGSTKTEETGRVVVFKPLASLAPGEKATWRVEVKAVAEGDVRIRVVMESDELTRPVEETEATHFFEVVSET